MKRRSFITYPLCSSALSCGTKREREASKDSFLRNNVTTLAGRTLHELREEYRYWLFDDFLHFLDRFVIDHELGGFKCNTDRDGTNITTDKQPYYDGRGVWVYSFLYRHFTNDPKHLEIALKTAGLLMKTLPEGDSLWPSRYDRTGRPLLKPDVRIYADAFVATGFQELAKATGETIWWDRAKNLLMKCVRVYDSKTYYPEFASVSYYLGPGAPLITGPRCLGEWMVLFRIAVQMLEFKSDPDVEEVRQRCIDAFFDHHYNAEFDLVNELVEFDMSRPKNEIAQMVYTGHAFQLLWMFMYEAIRSDDENLYLKSERLFRRHTEVALDDVYGGVFQCLKHVDRNEWILTKPLWAQEEPLVGLLAAIEQGADPWAFNLFDKLHNYVIDTFPMKKHGYSLWQLSGDRYVTFTEHASRVGNFHHPRHLMYNLMALDRMIERANTFLA